MGRRGHEGGNGLARQPTLDGLRGLAVAGVVVFHLDRLAGGFLGVDLFFVLSGYLITTLLLIEHAGHGAIDFRSFWGRRARRLLPALGLVLVAVAVYAVVAAQPSELARLRDELIATVAYVANWQQLWSGSGYWDAFVTPSLLRHTWSLAIEEQFYLVWPLVVLALGGIGARRWGRRATVTAAGSGGGVAGSGGGVARSAVAGVRPGEGVGLGEPGVGRGGAPTGNRLADRIMVVSALGAVAGWWAMAVLYDPLSSERAYLGTDTRAPALLVGAFVAALASRTGPVRGRRARVALEAAALGACALLGWAWFAWRGGDALLYRGGFVLCGLAVAVLIAALTHPVRGPLAHLFRWRPLVGLGLISYGLYLWHWPVIVVLDPTRVPLEGWALDGLRIAVSLALAVASYHLIEQPIRHGGLVARVGARRLVGAGVAVAVVAVATLVVVTARAPVDELALARMDAVAAVRDPLPPQADEAVGASRPVAAASPVPRPADRPIRVYVVGDSVGSSLAAELARQEADRGLLVANRGIPTCSLDDGPGLVRDDTGTLIQEPPVCLQWATWWADELATFKPDVVVVAFGGIQQGERQIDGTFRRPCDPEFGAWYERQLVRALDVLASRGALVAVTTLAYSTYAHYGDHDEATVDCLNDAIAGAAAQRPATARLVDLGRWVCPTDTASCARRVPGADADLRVDGLHYGAAGAGAAWDWMLPQLVADAPAPLPVVADGSEPVPVAGRR